MSLLNTEQQSAVEAPDGPALVLAGAGSGKTRVIVERIAWLIGERGVDARRILSLTFTNKAASEMRERISSRLGVDKLSCWMGTFHSFGLFVLRRNMDQLGRSNQFTIFDDSDQLSLMKRLIKGMPTSYSKVSPRDALQWISGLKQNLEEPEEEGAYEGEEATFAFLWKVYHRQLETVSAVDFDDLIVLTAKLFRDHEDVREKYRRWYPNVLVDEYQDTNHAQYTIARELAGPGGNLFVVGDEDQSIYSWRGADINNILDFEADFPEASIFRLEQNYRSTKSILAAANSVVSNNVNRLGKNLWTDEAGGDKVGFYQAEDGHDEAHFIVDTIAKKGWAPDEVAVLYRTNGQARVLEEAFRKKGLHYVVVGGIRFYDRKEIKDLICYLRVLVNPADSESLRRVINVPTRGIGATTLARLEDQARARQIPLLDALREAEDDDAYTSRVRNSAREVVELIDDLTWESSQIPLAELMDQLLERTGYRDYVQKSDEKDFRTRLELLDEFLSSCAEFDDKEEGSLEEYLQENALTSAVDTMEGVAASAALMTCHSAKGLEFNRVFLVGLEEGLLPHANSIFDTDSVEEERRLCYVGMTRARKTLILTAARERVVFGQRNVQDLSRFMGEVNPDVVEPLHERIQPKVVLKSEAPRADGDKLARGTKVRHAKFGRGLVRRVVGSGKKQKIEIKFDTGMTRLFVVSHTPLEIL